MYALGRLNLRKPSDDELIELHLDAAVRKVEWAWLETQKDIAAQKRAVQPVRDGGSNGDTH
jgi:hypothetical protein